MYIQLQEYDTQEYYSGQKKRVNGPQVAKYFPPVERGKFSPILIQPGLKELSHYYSENLIYKS